MQLTASDKHDLGINKELIGSDDAMWERVEHDPGITTPNEIYDRYKINMPEIYRANLEGKIRLGIKRPYDWVLIGKFSPLFTVKEINELTGIGMPALYKAIKENKIICFQQASIDGRRDEKGRFKAK